MTRTSIATILETGVAERNKWITQRIAAAHEASISGIIGGHENHYCTYAENETQPAPKSEIQKSLRVSARRSRKNETNSAKTFTFQ